MGGLCPGEGGFLLGMCLGDFVLHSLVSMPGEIKDPMQTPSLLTDGRGWQPKLLPDRM